MAAMTWHEVLKLPAWPSLRAIAPNAVALKKNLMRTNADQFVVVASHDRELRDDNPKAPFITAVIWAPSESAAVRCALHEFGSDEKNVVAQPPAELVPFDGPPTYAAIMHAARTKLHGDFIEHAEYKIDPSGKGQFVHKIVEVGRIGYYFRSAAARKTEIPYAIRISLMNV